MNTIINIREANEGNSIILYKIRSSTAFDVNELVGYHKVQWENKSLYV